MEGPVISPPLPGSYYVVAEKKTAPEEGRESYSCCLDISEGITSSFGCDGLFFGFVVCELHPGVLHFYSRLSGIPTAANYGFGCSVMVPN